MTDQQDQAELTTVDKLTAFIYLLARDHVPFGQVESTMWSVLQLHHKIVFSSEHIGEWAREVATRLMVEPGRISALSSCDTPKEDSDV